MIKLPTAQTCNYEKQEFRESKDIDNKKNYSLLVGLLYFSDISRDITHFLLRSSCVWEMQIFSRYVVYDGLSSRDEKLRLKDGMKLNRIVYNNVTAF